MIFIDDLAQQLIDPAYIFIFFSTNELETGHLNMAAEKKDVAAAQEQPAKVNVRPPLTEQAPPDADASECPSAQDQQQTPHVSSLVRSATHHLPPRWEKVVIEGAEYSLDHLNHWEIHIEDSSGVFRKIGLTFSDHVFTKEHKVGAPVAAMVSTSPIDPKRMFCPTRYALSHQLIEHLRVGIQRNAWMGQGSDNYLFVPTVDYDGRPVLYMIAFKLKIVTGLPVGLWMHVHTAHIRDQYEPTTFGEIRFKHLVQLESNGRKPKKITDPRRKRPKLRI